MTSKLDVDALILGAGIVGAATALHLQMRGRMTAIVDLNGVATGASFGNLGFVETGSVFPYPFPRQLGEMARYALNKSPSARIHWPAMPELAPMLMRYWWHSGRSRYQRLVRVMAPLMRRSLDEHFFLADQAGSRNLYRPGGWLTLVDTMKQVDKAALDIERLKAFGVTPQLLDREAAGRLEPRLGGEFAAAIHWAEAWTSSDPQGVVQALVRRFEALGGKVFRGDALKLRQAGPHWTLEIDEGTLTARDAVVALGAFSCDLVSKFGYRVPLAEKRGYHQMYAYPKGERLRLPVGSPAGGWAVVPLANGLRVGTGIEFTSRNAPPSFAQVDQAEASARAFVSLGERLTAKPWMGIRPFMPDMLPVIGPAPRHRGLWFAFGHAHHGFTLGPITGRLLAEWITDGVPSHDIQALEPARFGP